MRVSPSLVASAAVASVLLTAAPGARAEAPLADVFAFNATSMEFSAFVPLRTSGWIALGLTLDPPNPKGAMFGSNIVMAACDADTEIALGGIATHKTIKEFAFPTNRQFKHFVDVSGASISDIQVEVDQSGCLLTFVADGVIGDADLSLTRNVIAASGELTDANNPSFPIRVPAYHGDASSNTYSAPLNTFNVSAATVEPTSSPTIVPSLIPTDAPTYAPTDAPTFAPTSTPTMSPFAMPDGDHPTIQPTAQTTVEVTTLSSTPDEPTTSPTTGPTAVPSKAPSVGDVNRGTSAPSSGDAASAIPGTVLLVLAAALSAHLM
jgi:hypothetical protein